MTTARYAWPLLEHQRMRARPSTASRERDRLPAREPFCDPRAGWIVALSACGAGKEGGDDVRGVPIEGDAARS